MTQSVLSKVLENSNQVFFPNISENGITLDRVMFTIPG